MKLKRKCPTERYRLEIDYFAVAFYVRLSAHGLMVHSIITRKSSRTFEASYVIGNPPLPPRSENSGKHDNIKFAITMAAT